MSGTWRRAATEWAIAVVLGSASVGVFVVGAHQRQQIIDHGSSARAVITADHDGEIEHWYTVRYPARGETRSANLRAPWLIDKMAIGQVLTVYVDADRPERIVTANGYATPIWTPAPGWLMVLAMLAAFLAVVGHVSDLRRGRSVMGRPGARRGPG
jgi:uncharacterized protein DUF3592